MTHRGRQNRLSGVLRAAWLNQDELKVTPHIVFGGFFFPARKELDSLHGLLCTLDRPASRATPRWRPSLPPGDLGKPESQQSVVSWLVLSSSIPERPVNRPGSLLSACFAPASCDAAMSGPEQPVPWQLGNGDRYLHPIAESEAA